jgi:hypothetical protein
LHCCLPCYTLQCQFTGAGASNVVERIGGDQGNIHFTGIGAYNKVSNSANRGSIDLLLYAPQH